MLAQNTLCLYAMIRMVNSMFTAKNENIVLVRTSLMIVSSQRTEYIRHNFFSISNANNKTFIKSHVYTGKVSIHFAHRSMITLIISIETIDERNLQSIG